MTMFHSWLLLTSAILSFTDCKNLFIWKGTTWCGYGSSLDGNNSTTPDTTISPTPPLNTTKTTATGASGSVDSCCKEHDHCEHYIPRWKTKYHLVNWRPFTISSCECDQKFLKCLEKDDSLSAKDIKRIYFDILEVPCFNLQLKDVQKCAERTWFMACKKFAMKTELHATLTSLSEEAIDAQR